jgi:peptide/nickel transport system permease protein
MFSYLLRRLLYAPLIIVGVMLITFLLFFVLQKPETMAKNVLGKRANPKTTYEWMHKRGYDKPLFLHYGQQRVSDDGHPYASQGPFDTIFFNQLGKLATFDLGVSDVTGRELKEVFQEGAVPSLLLTLPAFIVGILMSVGFALYLVFVRKSALDTAGVFFCVGLMSIPPMVYIIFGQAVVAITFNYFPAFGFNRPDLFEPSTWNSLRFLLLPVAIMVILNVGDQTRLFRAVFLEEIGQDYVRTAQAKGVSNPRLLMVHVLKNGMIALITYVVAQLPLLILGSLLVENFFGIPGLGNTLVLAIQTSDLAVVRSTTFLTSILYIVGLTLTDICYALVDPRIRLS